MDTAPDDFIQKINIKFFNESGNPIYTAASLCGNASQEIAFIQNVQPRFVFKPIMENYLFT